MTLCMGRMRKEIMGSPPHAGRLSISRRASRKAVLLLLREQAGAGQTRAPGCERPCPRPGPAAHVSLCRARCW